MNLLKIGFQRRKKTFSHQNDCGDDKEEESEAKRSNDFNSGQVGREFDSFLLKPARHTNAPDQG